MDEDQSIYGFRAAYPEALLNFETDNPKARVLIMDQNYRSNAKISLQERINQIPTHTGLKSIQTTWSLRRKELFGRPGENRLKH